jgi:hypothetical protein
MSKHHSLWVLMLALMLNTAWGQDNSTPQPGGVAQDSNQAPAPAYGPDSATTPIVENPPLSGLDMPGLQPHAAPLSYLQAGVVVSETADSNVENDLGHTAVRSVSEGLGSLTLQRLWSNYDLALDYLGGVAYYNARGLGWKALQQMDVEQRVSWKRGQLAIRDAFSYLPEGNFGAEYGGIGGQGIGGQGITSVGASNFGAFWGGNTFATLAQVPRVSNLALVDVSENLTPKSAITAAGGYAFTHFTGNPASGTVPLVNNAFLGSSQVSAQVGYNRILTPHDQIALVYGYQGFDFTAQGTSFHSQVIQGMYGHRISGRMDFLIGAGPQFTNLSVDTLLTVNPPCISTGVVPQCPVRALRVGVAGRGQLRYRFTKSTLSLSYERYETSGSGFFAGAQTDVAQLRLTRPITRVWTGFADLGYSRNSRLQPISSSAVLANTFNYGFAGFGARRKFGRTLSVFGTYQFSEISFDSSFCLAQGVSQCNRISQRHLVTVGLEWTPRPMRID